MTEGIEILNTVTEMPEKSGSMIVFCIAMAVILAVCAGMCVYALWDIISDRMYMGVEEWVGMVILIVIAAGCCVGDYFLIHGIIGETGKKETIVYATIDESVPWSVVNEQYELVKQEGRIYQLRVKEKEGET